MNAIVWTKYGSPDVLQLREIAKPTPKDTEILIRVCATTVTAGDCELRRMQFPFWLALPIRLWVGLFKPTRQQILGQEIAGEVEAIGKDVQQYHIGDQVFGTTGFGFGGYAEYLCLQQDASAGVLAIKPVGMTFEEAAAVPVGGLTALHFLRTAQIQPGEKVLIIGAGGSIGSFGVQLARYYGAEVTVVDSARKFDMLRSIGADHCIDYTQEDYTKNGETYDVIFDVPGKGSFSRGLNALNPNGRYLVVNPKLVQFFRGWRISRNTSRKVIFTATRERPEDLIFLKDLIEAGKLKTIIDKRYSLAQIPEAHRYLETGNKTGNIIITLAHR